MKKRTIRILMSAVVMASLMSWSPAQANLYQPNDIVFGDVGIGTYNTFLKTPLREGWEFTTITCKWNQPRYIADNPAYSNPHRGVDQRTQGLNLYIYPPTNGWVVQTGSSSLYLELDMNRNGVQDDGIIFGYQHLSEIKVSNGQSVTPDMRIGVTGSDHLDWRFAQRDSRSPDGYATMAAHPYYVNVASMAGKWNNGLDLDYIVYGGFYQNKASYHIYVRSSDNVYYPTVNDVVLWYRKNGTSTWISTTMDKIGNYTFEKNIATLTGWPNGTKVDLLVRAERTDQGASNYRWAWYIPKYNQPDPPTSSGDKPNPNDGGLQYNFQTVTLGQ